MTNFSSWASVGISTIGLMLVFFSIRYFYIKHKESTESIEEEKAK